MATYGQPRRLNSVSIVLILMALAAGYWMWRFFPAYFDAWTVDHLLKEAASTTYRLSQLNEPERTKELKKLIDKVRADIMKQASVTDPDLVVNLDIQDNNSVVTAEYDVVVTHPVITRTTTIHFKRSEAADIKKVRWE
jgi:hypothetical protein